MGKRKREKWQIFAYNCRQGRNFGLKSGVSIQKENDEGPKAKGDARRMGRKYPPSSSDSGVWESVMSSPSWVRGGAQAENGFTVILRRPLLLTAGDIAIFTFLSWKVRGVLYPSVQKVGVPVPLVPP